MGLILHHSLHFSTLYCLPQTLKRRVTQMDKMMIKVDLIMIIVVAVIVLYLIHPLRKMVGGKVCFLEVSNQLVELFGEL